MGMTVALLCLAMTVHDGDTIRCGAERIRIADIDAPEVPGSPRCSPQSVRRLAASRNPAWCDYDKGERSREALIGFLSRGQVQIERVGEDRFGRTLALLSVGGKDAGEYLVGLGLARQWVK